jgi:hypothetical protein
MPTIANTMQNAMDTAWMFVAEVAVATSSYSDNIRNEDLTSAAEEDVVVPPPENLKGITHIASTNALAGFVGKRIYFSENNHYHNWPFFLDLDDNVCAIVESNNVLYVATSGHPYIISAAVGCEQADNRQAVRLPLPLPMAGCGNDAMLAVPQGAVYPSHDGLVALGGTSLPQLITTPFYSREDWQRLFPQSIIPVLHQGKLFCFGAGGSFAMNVSAGGDNGWTIDSHTELSDRVINAFTTSQGALYLVKADGLWLWDRGTTLRPHRWESAEVVANTEVNFGAGHVRVAGGGENLTVFVDRKKVLDRPILSPKQFRLPNWAIGTRWSFALEGTATVTLASFASSMKELTA